jgi:hypothetical protein
MKAARVASRRVRTPAAQSINLLCTPALHVHVAAGKALSSYCLCHEGSCIHEFLGNNDALNPHRREDLLSRDETPSTFQLLIRGRQLQLALMLCW